MAESKIKLPVNKKFLPADAYGLNNNQVPYPPNGDCNNLLYGCAYYGSGEQNKPSDYGHIFAFKFDWGDYVQIAFGNTGSVYYRNQFNNSGWGSWIQVW